MNYTKLLYQFSLIIFLLIISFVTDVKARLQHEVFFAGTDHEFHAYKIIGDKPGNTLMIIGGIQGDEPSGYLTADLYTDIHLRKGNLIVIPRANFYSILRNNRHGLTGDMNRKFGENPENRSTYDFEIVKKLKEMIHESDCLLNLHEGSGFYNPEWISDQENPKRYGQSIIYDAEVYYRPETGEEISVGSIAKAVAQEVNQQILNKRYLFRANNHETISDSTQHEEQRKSASFYAMTKAHIPAFGIEISKTIPSLETKVRLSKLVINSMLRMFGIEVDAPGIGISVPKLDYLLVKVNDNYPVALSDGTVFSLASGDEVTVVDIVSNYKRGLVADIAGFGSVNDTNQKFIFNGPTRVVVKKDASAIGWIDFVVDSSKDKKLAGEKAGGRGEEKPLSVADLKAESLLLDVNGKTKKVENYGTISIPKRGFMTMQEIKTNISMMDNEVVVNFKGFVPPKTVNDGNDLRFPINLTDDLWEKYSEGGLGVRYPIKVSYLGKDIGQFWVEIVDVKGSK